MARSWGWHEIFRRAGWDGPAARRAAASPQLRQAALDFLLPLLPSGLSNPKLFIDVGAHTGRWAAAARRLYPNTPVHCFEPVPEVAAILSRNLQSDAHAHIYCTALGSHSSRSVLNRYTEPVLNSLLPLRERYRQVWDAQLEGEFEVRIEPLDSFGLHEPGSLIWMKVDVQGTEHAVIDGAEKTLDGVQLLIIEVAFASVYEDDTDFWSLHRRLLGSHGFVLYNLGNLHREPGPELVWGDAVYVRPNNVAPGEPIGGDNFLTTLRLTDI